MHRPYNADDAAQAPRAWRDRILPRDGARRLTGWWTLAALLHLALLLVVLRNPAQVAPDKVRPARPTQQQIARAVAAARRQRAAPSPTPEPPKPERTRPRPKGQVVELAPGESQPPPDDAKYLAERDSRVDKPQSAPPKPRQPPAPAPGTQPSAPPPPTPASQAPRPAAAPAQPPRAAPSRIPLPDGHETRPHGPSAQSGALRRQPRKGQEEAQGPHQAQGPRPPARTLTLAQLIPSMGALAQQMGAPPPPAGAAVPDIEEGGATLLNARAFKHASYFNRLMRSVEQFWHPVERYQRLDPQGQMFGIQPRLTVLEVTLDATGHLVDARVLEASGVYFLDDEAVAAFRRAEPFNHPPGALIEPDGHIRFSVGFHFRVH